ncbi:efflux RND transporter periplasmic adaptor subunit [Neptunicella sp. SCSIO 80796]|uniref:efflux RND transporter periplasmic adaptor subunit n=1 Tax=Neptunicella plasticusilytica TaxID=3117012 RepID=UPI003A4E4E47
MNNKSELLQQLQIDRSEAPAVSGVKLWQAILLALVCSTLAVWLTLTFASGSDAAPAQAANTTPSGSSTNKATAANSQSAPSTPAKVNDNNAILNSSGYITARRMATVSAEIMGLIKEVDVEEGMSVEEGQVLARLDDTLAKANLDFAQAQIGILQARRESTEATLQEAQRNQTRMTSNKFSSEADITRSQTEVQSLTANLKSIEADIKVANIEVRRQRERLDDHTIRAPFAGVVTVKNAQPGEIVAPASAGGGFTRTGICTIVDMQSLEIEVDVNESFIGRVKPGQKVEANLEAYPDWTIPASVVAIIPTADRAKATVQVRIKIELQDERILPDMGVKVAFLKI